MKIGTLYWFLLIIWLLFGTFSYWPANAVGFASYLPLGGNLMLWVLLALLGWKVFGPILQKE